MRSSVATLRDHFKQGKAALIEHFLQSRATAMAANSLTRTLTRHVDSTLVELWEHTAMPPGAALVAVGGYGRGELFPHSDIDLLVLLPTSLAPQQVGHGALLHEGPDEAFRAAIEGFVAASFDIGLWVGWSVRTLDECKVEASADITVQTAMLEARLLCGSRHLFVDFRHTMAKITEPRAFLRAKLLEMRQRHIKFEDTPYSLEPNCKESPGGLRDLQVVIWASRAAKLGKTWKELEGNGLATPFEVKQLHRHEGTIKLIRARLHAVAGRREDRLVFDLQTAVATSIGYTATKAQRSSEILMHRYYWAAKAVTQLNQILILNIEERINASEAVEMRPINERFFDRAGLLEVASDDLYLRNPHAILETFLVYQQTTGIKGLSARTLRALYNTRNVMDAKFRRDPENRRLFIEILRQPNGQTHVFRLMNQTSVLGRYLWVFRRIVGRMQHDLFHVYTVDQHILMVLRNVRRFFMAEHGHEYPFCTQIASQWDRPWVLFIAALFHDVAKGRGGDHSDLGAREVRRFCKDHGIDGDDAALIEFLVRNHLTMSHIAQKSDLSDIETIRAFAAKVGSPRWLDGLYLLTVADIRGTSPKVWNAWKGKLLEDLYRLTLRTLGGAQRNMDAEIEARKQEAIQDLARRSALPGTEEPLWRTLELSYFARHEAAEIAWHARSLWRHVQSKQPVVCARLSPVGEGLQVLVYACDRPDLFARTCGYFDGRGFSIQDAKIHTSRTGYALDTYQIVNPNLGVEDREEYRVLVTMVENGLTEALLSDATMPPPSRGRVSRRVKSFPITPRVSLRPDERAQRWLLSVSTSDRSGLLYSIALVLARHSINLQLAKVITLGERVEDMFLIDGPMMSQSKQQVLIESEVLDAISPQPLPTAAAASSAPVSLDIGP